MLLLPLRLALRAPLLVAYAVAPTSVKRIIRADVARWRDVLQWGTGSFLSTFVRLLGPRLREFRNLSYHRLAQGGVPGRVLARLLHSLYVGERTLFLNTHHIGPGLFIQHGFATIVAAERIGANCRINQQVTIGYNLRGLPTIGDDVRISAGAVVLGPVSIGDGAVVGANATVVKDVPPGGIAIGPAAQLLESREGHGGSRSRQNGHVTGAAVQTTSTTGRLARLRVRAVPRLDRSCPLF
jgi:serine O-acetyltransferase